ncbi:MAG: hypothetical protein GY810_10175 [Aureispira sp.]|nr:hypothetical protein [Aureispira sp.]
MKLIYTLIFSVFCISYSFAQKARLEIVNSSQRTLLIKVMKRNYGGNDRKHSTLTIQPGYRGTEYFSSTGDYYLKTKATKRDRKPMYEKGKPFEVYVGHDGYSVLTVTYSITESSSYNPLDGKSISEAEFEKDY